ncbi:MAG: apolipoprotein N-acyltransferase [Planctomycetaceae bacterium]|nr:apolipoprotein N-acyltransferase [Planctomycetaceae bacterium]
MASVPQSESPLPPPPARTAWWAAMAAATLTWAAFFPLDWGMLGWIYPVPLLLLARLTTPPRHLYRALYLAALAGTTASLQWMRLGDTWMIPAWLALSAYTATYVPLFVAITRVAVHRYRVPLGIAGPVTWIGAEFARAHLLTGFAWYFLGHTQYRWTELIQVSDLVGAYGVSFVVALCATALAVTLPARWLVGSGWLPTQHLQQATSNRNRPRATTVAALSLLGLVVAYGVSRRGQSEFTAGPRIALVQGNFLSSLKHDPAARGRIVAIHRRLTGLAVREQPDVIVWPETMFRWPLLESAEGMTDEQLRQAAPRVPPQEWKNPLVRELLGDLASEAGAALVVGLERIEAEPRQMKTFNSAVLVRPDTGLVGRYDKLHRVPFGEYIPLTDLLPWLHHLTPFPADYGVAAGNAATVFRHRSWQLLPLICFEDTVPHLVRSIVSRADQQQRRPDVMVNLTNDGWFHGSSELDQHLVTAAFRSVECRTPMVRAVNTGISAIIDGDGVIREPEMFIDGDAEMAREQALRDESLDREAREARLEMIEAARRTSLQNPRTGRWQRQLNAVLVDVIPLDNRRSIYVATGDWFAGGCGLACLIVILATAARLCRRRDKSVAGSPDS